jgi:hypothetical protein
MVKLVRLEPFRVKTFLSLEMKTFNNKEILSRVMKSYRIIELNHNEFTGS